MVLIGDHNGYLRCTDDLITDPENGLKSPGALNLEIRKAVLLQMLRHGSFCRLDGIGLGVDVGSHRSRMTPPVIHQPGYMDNLLRIVREP